MSVVTATLENWSYDPNYKCFWGEIHGDVNKRWRDGTPIHTSHAPYPEAQEGDLVKTLNSTYRLGKPQLPKSQTL